MNRTAGTLLLLILLAPARERANAQFTPPYDPDFERPAGPARPPEREEPRRPRVPLPEEPPQPGEAPAPLLPGGPYLLLDRADPGRILTRVEASTAPVEFEEFEKSLKPLRWDPSRWNRMRTDLEEGRFPLEEIEVPVLPLPPGELLVSTAAPRPPEPEVEGPAFGGTSLSVSGRKIVGFQFSEKRFLNDQKTSGRPQSANLVDIQQQLQLRMQGKVGPKIAVNVDYDDTKTNKQDISVVYTGDENEVVQNASFGDIDLSLPASEFVTYNKQVFGIRADVKWKGFRGHFIGSRTKGTTKTKQFIGNTQFVRTDILDTAYIRRTHYDLSFDSSTRLPIAAGSERVFLAQQNPQAINTNSVVLTADDFGVPSSTFTGSFIQLQPGQDYTIDYVKGTLTFRTRIEAQFVLAADYVDARGARIADQTPSATSGGTGRLKLIKTPGDVPISQSTATAALELGHNRELKTFYSVGAQQIVRDDGRGNFFLRVLDPHTRNEVGPDLNPIQKYPDTVEVDFENGFFRLLRPFGASTATATPDPQLYSPTPISKRIIQVEYRFRLRTFFLEPNLVFQSEVVQIDGVRMSRNVDYFIDYESGFITFYNEDRIRPDSVIDARFEVAPFAGITSESILGTRVSHEFNKHLSLGSTLLFQGGSKPPSVPSITDLAKNLLIYEADSQLKDVWLLPALKATLQGEVARSHQNPNLAGSALIDNMEGVKQEEAAGLLTRNWQIASNPGQTPADPRTQSLFNEDFNVLAINPKAQAGPNETQKVLDLAYDFTVDATTETSIALVFSPTGVDLSQKSILEVVMLGDASGNEISFKLGGVNEDSDGDGTLDTEDANNDNILQAAEDIGFLYNPAGKGSARLGGGNGFIDTEDLNRNQRLDPEDLTGDSFGYAATAGTKHNELFDVTSGSSRTALDFGPPAWHTFQIPLDISTATLSRWTAIKEIRISVRKGPASVSNTGTLKFARIAAVGNSWQLGRAGDFKDGSGAKGVETLSVTAVNSVDNPGYSPIFSAGGDAQAVFNDLYGSAGELQRQTSAKNVSEQALQLLWSDLAEGATVSTKRVFARAIDVSQHRNFNFLLYGNADPNNANLTGDKVFFLRMGSDRDFFEMRIPLNFTGWRKFTARQADLNGDQIPDRWELGQGTPGTVVLSTGNPNFQQIASLVAGVYGAGPSAPTRGAAWLNEIHVTDPIQRVGQAQKVQADFEVPGWATFGAKYRSVDRHYQTPTTSVSNQDNRQDNAYLNLTRLAFFPMSFAVSRAITDTPNTNRTGDLSNLVNLLQQGVVKRWNGNAAGNFAYGAWPRLSLGYLRDRTEYDLLTRLDDRNTYNSALSYAVPGGWRLLPTTVDGNLSYTKYSVSFENLLLRRTPGVFNTDEFSLTYGTRLGFAPWTGATFNPNFSQTKVKERRSDLTSGLERVTEYPKSLNETAGFSSSLRLLSWLNPSVNYTVTNIENNILSVSTFVVQGSTHVFGVGDIKTVNRSANGSVSLPLSAVDIFPRTRLFKSFSLANSYQLQDGDVWNNVEKGLSTELALWVRSPLRPASPAAQRVNLTLRDTYSSTQRWSPLEAYGITGRKDVFKSLALTNNFVRTIQKSETTGTRSKTIATTLPDVVASLTGIERILWADRWMSHGQINLKYQAHETETIGVSRDTDDSIGTDLRSIIRKRYDTALSLNFRNTKKKDLRLDVVTQTTHHEDATLQTTFDIVQFRFTPKVDYLKDVTQQGTGVQTQNTRVITPSLLVRADLALPRGLVLPLTGKTILFTNRVIWTNNLSFALRSSPVTQADNSRLLLFNTSGDYEIAKNLRMTLNGAFSRLWHKFLKEEDFISYQFGTTLTFQF